MYLMTDHELPQEAAYSIIVCSDAPHDGYRLLAIDKLRLCLRFIVHMLTEPQLHHIALADIRRRLTPLVRGP